MGLKAFDTLHYVELLESEGIPANQARVQALALSEVLESQMDRLATKEDMERLHQNTKDDIKRLEQSTKNDIERLEQNTKNDIERLEKSTKNDMERLYKSTKNDMERLDQKLSQMGETAERERGYLKVALEQRIDKLSIELRQEMHSRMDDLSHVLVRLQEQTSMMRWVMGGTFFGVFILTFRTFFHI